MSFEKYVDFALDIPVYALIRDGNYIRCTDYSFADLIEGKHNEFSKDQITIKDWADHISTIFTEVRLKTFIEMRGADAGGYNTLCALPAFWVGICYDQGSLDAAWDIVKSWDKNDRENLRIAAAEDGLNGSVGSIRLIDLAKETIRISENGLKNRAQASSNGLYSDESHFLDSLKENIEKRKSSADDLLEKYHGSWNRDLTKIFEEYSY